jgi:hypothetical protein
MAEFGFFGVVVYTRVHTPLLCGQESKAGDFDFEDFVLRPFLTNCCIVGIQLLLFFYSPLKFRTAKVGKKFFYAK